MPEMIAKELEVWFVNSSLVYDIEILVSRDRCDRRGNLRANQWSENPRRFCAEWLIANEDSIRTSGTCR